MGADIYLIEKTREMPRLPAEARRFVDIEEGRAYSLDEIREMVKDYENNGMEDRGSEDWKDVQAFLEACESYWKERSWESREYGADFLVDH